MDELKWLVDLAQSAGGASGPIFAVMWLLEWRERRRLILKQEAAEQARQLRDNDLFEKVLTASSAMTQSLAAMTQEQQEGRRLLDKVTATIETLSRRRS